MESGKKLDGKIKAIIAIVASIIVIGVGILIFTNQNQPKFKKLTGTSEEIIVAALYNDRIKTLQELEQREAVLGTEQIEKFFEQEAAEIDFKLGFKGISGVENSPILSAMFNNASITSNIQMSKDYNKVNNNLKVNMSGLELFKVEGYKNQDEVGINIPKIFDSPYAVKLENWVDDYNASALRKLYGNEEITQIDAKIIEESMSASKSLITGINNLMTDEHYMEQTEALVSKYLEKAKLKENGTEKFTLTDGSEKDLKVYSGTMKSEDVMAFLKEDIKLAMELDFMKGYIQLFANEYGQTEEEIVNEIMDSLDESEQDINFTDINIDMYVDDTFFRGYKMEFMDGSESLGEIVIKYNGSKIISDQIEVEFLSEDFNIQCNYTRNLEENADIYNEKLVLSASAYDEEVLNCVYEYNYEPKKAEDNLNVTFEMDINDDYNEALVKYIGEGTKVVSKQEVSTDLANSSFEFNTHDTTMKIDFELKYDVCPIKEADIEINQTDAKYPLEMSEDELNKELEDIQKNLESFMYGMQ